MLGGAAGMAGLGLPASRKGRQLHGGLAFGSPRARHLRAPLTEVQALQRCTHVPINLTATPREAIPLLLLCTY